MLCAGVDSSSQLSSLCHDSPFGMSSTAALSATRDSPLVYPLWILRTESREQTKKPTKTKEYFKETHKTKEQGISEAMPAVRAKECR